MKKYNGFALFFDISIFLGLNLFYTENLCRIRRKFSV